MSSRIDVPAKYELRIVIRLYQAADENIAAEIHRRMNRVYGKNFRSDGGVRECGRKFKDGRIDIKDEEDKTANLSQQKILFNEFLQTSTEV
ncbi:hypothetical protein AVEN_49667-1 [Araneus ventricosus]|uniref:Mos1 transposase HTH domain-containing protein n=1 Tax=Araneus ventricosus TaxID=182803 RepID=A0A4Y2JMH4_ARAVE|nr:hypothetical protein AVEN_49667-1 [Araneus ventricosus]